MKDFRNPHGSVEYSWSVGELLQALLDAGLALERFEEFEYANGCALFEDMRVEGRRHYPGPKHPQVPLMFGLRAGHPERSRGGR